jgi:cytochrome c oxidase assembly protein subunit 15
MAQPLYDLSPALRLIVMAALLALAPLAWVWLRTQRGSDRGRVQALTLLTLFLTFDLVLFGAFTRLTDSGLGCPDWPGCYGNASALGARVQIEQAQAAMPTGPVTHAKAWIEMVHRYLAMAVGVLIATLAAAAWWRRKRGDPVNVWWPAATLAWVCLQGAFGALTVTMKLFPAIVTLHLLGGMVLLALLCRQAVAWDRASRAGARVPIAAEARAGLVAVFALVWLQVALGAWVSTNYAVLACGEFPKCQGGWWPAMDFRAGFQIWRDLGMTSTGEPITFAALTAIHFAHRMLAYAVLAALGLVAWRLRQSGALRAQARCIAALALWQLATGVSNVVFGWPLAAAVSHTGGAAALVVILTWALCASTSVRAGARVQPDPRRVAT